MSETTPYPDEELNEHALRQRCRDLRADLATARRDLDLARGLIARLGDIDALESLAVMNESLKSRVAELERERDEARAQAEGALKQAAFMRREMEPCEVHHGARRSCGQCLSSAEAHVKDLRAQLADVAARDAALTEACQALDEIGCQSLSAIGSETWSELQWRLLEFYGVASRAVAAARAVPEVLATPLVTGDARDLTGKEVES